MKILIADDEPVIRRVLEVTLTDWGYDVVIACDGVEAWQAVQTQEAPPLLILDWVMPGMDGLEVCRKIRQSPHLGPTYIILLSAKDQKADIITGLQAGANDYMSKPFHRGELYARIQVGVKMVTLQRDLAAKVKELEDALSRIKQLQGLLPICSYCKKIRNDKNYWQQLEHYIAENTEAQFSHSVCPDCYDQFVKPELEKLGVKLRQSDDKTKTPF